jgi:hypothetical protein
VDLSSLSQDEKERALEELAPHNAVAAFSLLTMALCDSAGSVDQDFALHRTLYPSLPNDPLFANHATKGLFTPEVLCSLTSVATQTAQAMGQDCLTGYFSSTEHCPCPQNLLVSDLFDNPDEECLTSRVHAEHLRSTARQYMEYVYPTQPDAPSDEYTSLEILDSDSSSLSFEYLHGRVSSIDSQPLPRSYFDASMRDGIYVIELFGGMCGGLQMLLDNGFTIRQYFYCDVSPAARQVAEHRLMSLHSQFPAQFPFEAWQNAFSLPQDVYLLDREALLQAGCDNGRQWFFIAGFECQDLSPAGRGRGLFGPRSQTFFPMLQVLGELQILQHEALLPMYFIENTAMNSVDSSTVAVRSAYDEICSRIGIPVSLDAARVNSYAHRLRYYWQNLSHPLHVQTILDTYDRDPSLALTDILDPGRFPQICTRVS